MSGVCEGCNGLYYYKSRNNSLLERDPLTPFVRTGNPDSYPTASLRDVSGFCPICRDLWGAIEAFAQGREVSETFGFELWTWRTGQVTLYLQFKAGGEDVKIEFYSEVPLGNRDLGYWSVKRRVIADTGSDEAFTLVKSWVDDCVNSHPDCRNHSDEEPASKLPTRVLDVGAPGDTSQLKLFITKGVRAPYVALSHCWGKLPLLNTTKATLNERVQGIEMASLPPAFQDAVTITRRLGLQYLWIDSLCIVQDDASDWDSEAAQMANVYGEAFLTIANAWSDTSTKPILRPYTNNDPDTLAPFQTRMLRAKVRRAINHEGGPNPLSTRAWTLQERVLSKRIIHYDSHEMWFECREGGKCECSSYQMPIRGGVSTSTGPKTFAPWGDDSSDRLRLWFDLVEEYSKRNLTVGSDKIPAFYGMAQQFLSRDFGFGSIVAGCWEDAWLLCALWTTAYQAHRDVDFPTGQKHRPPKYRAPTWSWAAIDGQLWYPDDVLHTMRYASWRCSTLGYTAVAAGNAGQIQYAEMRVRSFVIDITVELPAHGEEKRKDHQQQWRIVRGDIGCWFTPDAPLYDIDAIEGVQKVEPVNLSIVEQPEALKEKKKSGLRKLFSRDKDKDKDKSKTNAPQLANIPRTEKGNIKCLLLAHGSDTYKHDSADTSAVISSVGDGYRGLGLVLKPSKTTPGAFERVGLVILYDFARDLFNDSSNEILTLV